MRLDHDFFKVKFSNDDGTNAQVPPMTVEETARGEGIEDEDMEVNKEALLYLYKHKLTEGTECV